MTPTIDRLVASGDELGEGPCWSEAEQRLYWFDILARKLLWFEPATKATGAWTLPVRASAGAPRAQGGLLAATEAGLAEIATRTGALRIVRPFKFPAGYRTNDGKIDPLGRFWWSTMDERSGRPGALYVTKADGRTQRVLDGVVIANSLSSSADGATLYFADSAKKTITAYDVDPKSARLSRARPFADVVGQACVPDGSAVDAEGCLWNAQWGGSRVVRYSPAGEVLVVIEMPVSQPTCCCFGGPDLSVLYVTSARVGVADEPQAGALFAFDPGVKGQALPAYSGKVSRWF